MPGFLIPPWYADESPSATDLNIASIIWGISLASAFFTASRARQQTWRVWRRTGGINPYIALVWGEWISNTVFGVVSWLFLRGTIAPSFQVFFIIVTLWAVQTQCIMQILVNRIGLITRDETRIFRLRWAVFIAILLINISVYIIWIPARLQISPTWVNINHVWDRIEKSLFLLIDAALSSYFAYLVRSRLIANGLTKYNRLFRWNVAMIIFSVSLDVILVAVLSIGHGFVYVQFHPLVYLLKLHIELNLTELLAKIVRLDEGESHSSGPSRPSKGTTRKGKSTGQKSTPTDNGFGNGKGIKMTTLIAADNDNDIDELPKTGIHKTVETEIRYDESDVASHTSSTRELHSPFDYK